MNGADDASGLVTVTAFRATLRPFTRMPFVEARHGGGARTRVDRLLGHLVIQAFLQRILSAGRVFAADFTSLLGIVALFALKTKEIWVIIGFIRENLSYLNANNRHENGKNEPGPIRR